MTPDGALATTPYTAHEQSPAQQSGVLAALPRTRPQRASARRAAARGKAESETTATARAAAGSRAEGSTGARRKRSPQKDSPKKDPSRARAGHPENKQPTTAPATAPRARTRAKTKTKTAGKAGVKSSLARAGRAPKPRLTAAVKPPEPAVPKQGYEPEQEVELGKPVSPPSGLELVESLAAVVGELAAGSLSAGGRLLKDAVSGLRRP